MARPYQVPPYQSVASLAGPSRYPHLACQRALLLHYAESPTLAAGAAGNEAPAPALEGMHNRFERQSSLDIAPLSQPLEVNASGAASTRVRVYVWFYFGCCGVVSSFQVLVALLLALAIVAFTTRESSKV